MLNPLLVEDAVRAALLEDLGRAGDITTNATIPAAKRARAVIAARQPGSNEAAIGPDIALTAVPRYFNGRAASIYGGSNEIQRNILAKQMDL